MLQIFLYSFPSNRARMAVISYSQFPTLLRQLNANDVLVLDFVPFSSFGSLQDHKRYVHPFLMCLIAYETSWLIRSPNLSSLINLYNLPCYVVLEHTEVVYIASDVQLLNAYRLQHMFNSYFSKNSPNHFSEIPRFLDNLKILTHRTSKHILLTISQSSNTSYHTNTDKH